MSKTTLLLMLAVFSAQVLTAQNWKKSRKTGDELYEQGKYVEAAAQFEEAFKKKPKNKDLAYKAAQTYHTIRDYRKAAEYFNYIKDDNTQYPMSGLKYAGALKQDGRYEEAKRAFQNYLDKYSGTDKALMQQLVNREIAGCELGKELSAKTNKETEIYHLGRGVNTEMNEFAPVRIREETIFYSSASGRARILKSALQGKEWSKGANPDGFPDIKNDHYCNGSLSEDGNRFYFNICRGRETWGPLTARCEIYVIKKEGNGWSDPKQLPEYINMSRVTATQPAVATLNGIEYLFFSSNREGGKGGMDIWYVSRELTSGDTDFSFPVNLGDGINTPGDEMTPFYDVNAGKLYFASSGHPTVGGLDIFSSRGMETTWGTAENLGFPINSPADDYYFSLQSDGYSGLLSSNRAFGSQKKNTHDEDIFEFKIGGRRLMVKATAYDRESGAPLPGAQVSLYQVLPGNVTNLLLVKDFPDGAYTFEILPGRTFKIVIQSPGYESVSYEFSSTDPSTNMFGKAMYLDKIRVTPPPVTIPSGAVMPGDSPYTLRGIGPDDNLEYTGSAPRLSGQYFKVQIIALEKYKPGSRAYDKVKSLAESLETEFIAAQGLTRVMLANFFTAEAAYKVMEQVKKKGFPDAFVVRYEDGTRWGKEIRK
jgi:hypothetical protein